MLKFFVLVALLATLALCAPDSKEFHEWMTQHGKTYHPSQIDAKFAVWKSNVKRIAELNMQNNGVKFALNQFADMSPEEFQQTILMPSSPAPVHPEERYAPELNVNDLPESFDWREKGAVSVVKDQGSAGSCWAFSTAGNIEGQMFLTNQTSSVVSLSVEQLVDCDYKDCGVFGGWPYLAMEYVMENGLQTEEDYKYCCGSGEIGCYPCMANTNKTFCGPGPSYCDRHCLADKSKYFAHVKSWVAINSSEDQIAAQLISRGPLSVLLDASLLSFYHSGVWDPVLCSKTSLDHAVLLVGYGVESGLFGKKPYWIVKNSWGTKWGEKGYFRIARGKGKCGINTGVTSAVV